MYICYVIKNKENMKPENLFTVYTNGVFGVSKQEVKLLDFGTKKYAQYNNAVFVHFIKKGKRKPEGFVKGYKPYMLILEGINHPEPADAFGPVQVKGDLETKMTRFSSFDDRYLTEFDEKISEYIKDKNILMDVRFTVNTNLIKK